MKKQKRPPEEHCRTILDSIADGVFTVDLNSRITSFNRAASEITGITKEKAMGKPCFQVLRGDICKEGCMLKQTLDTRTPMVNVPVHIIRADKKKISISASTTLLEDTEGRVIGGVEIFRDLTTVNRLRRALRKAHSFDDIVSKNQKMLRIFSILPQIAESNSTVLIEGASGTGKELIARAIHHHSPKRKGRFVPVNCGALPDTLCESELFGYKAGAFTDAKRDKAGRFELARNGSLFLDEIGDISLPVQVRLLRVLQEKIYEPLGSTKRIRTDARIIAATHQDLKALVKQGLFREDLYFRINVVRISLPGLSERKEDIPLLVDHFVDHFNHLKGRKVVGVSGETMAALMLYDWPGNIRELENAIEYAFVICQGALIQLKHLPEHLIPKNGSLPVPVGLTLREAEERTILQALERNNWKRVATARELGIDKNTLRRKIKRFDISVPSPASAGGHSF